jgi:UDP-N-acetylmuramate-alanine ligase
LGHRVTGSDANVYPPMSTQLESAGIRLMEGYAAAHLQPAPDVVVVGNAMKRGIPAVEYMLDAGLRYLSGPQWLAEHLLADRHVLAVAGTHGKTTTSSMLAWLLQDAGLDPRLPDRRGAAGLRVVVLASAAGAISWWRPMSTIRPFSTSALSSSTTARAR